MINMIHDYRLHQMQGNQIYGFRKSGYLLKKSEGKMRVKAWRKRRCEITDGFLYIYHSDETQPPTKLNLLTCQVKLVPGKEKKCFDLISYNRTYHFQVEDEHDITAWVYVLVNCKEGALKKQFDDSNYNNKDFVDFGNDSSNTSLQQKPQRAHMIILSVPGNDKCADCGAPQPRWASINLGITLCIECAGIHRSLGVHLSKVRSLTLDTEVWSPEIVQFMLSLGNTSVNSAYMACYHDQIPMINAESSREERENFIRSKYFLKLFMKPPDFNLDDTSSSNESEMNDTALTVKAADKSVSEVKNPASEPNDSSHTEDQQTVMPTPDVHKSIIGHGPSASDQSVVRDQELRSQAKKVSK